MKKPLVFISHITPEQELAHSLRDLIQSTFMGMIDVFVSSDPDSIAMGGKMARPHHARPEGMCNRSSPSKSGINPATLDQF